MKQRLLTLALALAALLLFYMLYLPKPPPDASKLSEPVSSDAGLDGELAMWRWLTAEGIPVTSLKLRYTELAVRHGSPGNVLVTVMPHRLLIRPDEWSPLTRWIEAGNTVLVLAAMNDTPRWTLGKEAGFLSELQTLSGITFTVVPPPKSDEPAPSVTQILRGVDITLKPKGEHPLLAGVQQVHASSELPSARWRGAAKGQDMPLALMQREDDGEPALWLLRHGKGQVIVLTVASPFTNREIDQADNARLLANIVAWSRAPTGAVMFDDAHQGITDYYDAHAFFADPRLHRTLWWIVLLWLAFVLGPLPLRSAFSPWRPIDETALIDAGGRYFSNAVSRTEAAQRLLENFFNRLRGRLGLPENGQPLWEWLGAQAVPAAERARLQSLYAKVCADERVNLTQLQNLLTDIQGRLA